MKVIYKYSAGPSLQSAFTLTIPHNYTVRDIAMQGSELCVWAEVETDNIPLPVHFVLTATGHIMSGLDLIFIKTIHVGGYVWHVYIKG